MSKLKNAGASRTDSDPVDLSLSHDFTSFSVTSASYSRCFFPNSSAEHIKKFQVSMNLVEDKSVEDKWKPTIGDLKLNLDIQLGRSGSNVFLGSYNNRNVAVKRSHCIKICNVELARLDFCDNHPYIVKLHSIVSDNNYNYICLELCKCSLDTLISFCSSQEVDGANQNLIKLMQGRELWDSNGNPSKILVDLMRNIVSALEFLHKSGIVHTTINPENILVADALTTLTAKLSHFSCSFLLEEKNISTSTVIGSSNLGWVPNDKSAIYALDMFSFGCVLFYSITGGRHPFGDEKDRVINIGKNNPICLSKVNHLPEAKQLINSLLESNPKLRPSASDVLIHPMFWNKAMKNQFITDAINEKRMMPSVAKDWYKKVDQTVLGSMKSSYDGSSFLDLLRFYRNCEAQYTEIEKTNIPSIKGIMGDMPNGFYSYFELLMVVYEIISRHYKSDLKGYFEKIP